ncbi:hypothetical protein BG005_009138, partial [Podila minutissima]
ATLAGKRAADLHGQTILGSDTTPNNVTRYWLISRHQVHQPDRNMSPKSSFALVMKNQVGALHRVCSSFALRDINITKLESRPSSRTITLASPWEYVTYIDIGAPQGTMTLSNDQWTICKSSRASVYTLGTTQHTDMQEDVEQKTTTLKQWK